MTDKLSVITIWICGCPPLTGSCTIQQGAYAIEGIPVPIPMPPSLMSRKGGWWGRGHGGGLGEPLTGPLGSHGHGHSSVCEEVDFDLTWEPLGYASIF